MSYQPPIDVNFTDHIIEDVKTEMDEYLIRAVQKVIINVDKDELLKALAYDREQYEKGYTDGKRESVDVVQCQECEHYKPRYFPDGRCYGVFCELYRHAFQPDFYCKSGSKRKEDSENT